MLFYFLLFSPWNIQNGLFNKEFVRFLSLFLSLVHTHTKQEWMMCLWGQVSFNSSHSLGIVVADTSLGSVVTACWPCACPWCACSYCPTYHTIRFKWPPLCCARIIQTPETGTGSTSCRSCILGERMRTVPLPSLMLRLLTAAWETSVTDFYLTTPSFMKKQQLTLWARPS